jgi:hypothetical protein
MDLLTISIAAILTLAVAAMTPPRRKEAALRVQSPRGHRSKR